MGVTYTVIDENEKFQYLITEGELFRMLKRLIETHGEAPEASMDNGGWYDVGWVPEDSPWQRIIYLSFRED